MILGRKRIGSQSNFYANFNILVNEGIELGIFFKFPIRKLDINDNNKLSDEIEKIRSNKLYRIFNILIGNRKFVWFCLHLHNHDIFESDAWHTINVVEFPIYFHRRYLSAKAESTEHSCTIRGEGYYELLGKGICNKEEINVTYYINGIQKIKKRLRKNKKTESIDVFGIKEIVKSFLCYEERLVKKYGNDE